MEILFWPAVFIITLAALIKSADIFTDNAEKIGLHFRISPFIIGVTIIALGTSLPELASSIAAVLDGNSEIVVGNVVGSNMANILLVLAITAIVGKHLFVDKDIINIDLPILLGSSIFLFLSTLDGEFGMFEGILGVLMLATYLIYNAKSHREISPLEKQKLQKEKQEIKKEEKRGRLPIKYPIFLLLSGLILSISAKYLITSVTELSTMLKIGTEVIALSLVAVGTSLPELVVSIVAIKKGKADIAIGNVTGSNIFNALGVMGIPALFGTLTIPPDIIAFSIPALLFTTILYLFVTMDKQVSQWEGITLLLLYVAFMGKIFGLI
ncbi:MAG: calcium/sodium antiporter [Nitrospirota bacterium]